MFSVNSFNATVDSAAVLGNAVWWTIHRKSASFEYVKSAIADAGLDTENLPEPSAKKSFGRTAKALSSGSRFYRKVVDDSGRLVLGQVSEDVDRTAESVAYDPSGKAQFVKNDKSVVVEGDGAEAFLAKYGENLEMVQDTDIRAFVLSTIHQIFGVSLRKTGGIYFVPAVSSGALESLGRFLEQTGLGVLYTLRVPNGAGERAVTWESFEASVDERIAETLGKVGKIGKAGCLPKHTESLEGLQAHLAAYSSLCGDEGLTDRVKAKIQAAQDVVASRLTDLAALKQSAGA